MAGLCIIILDGKAAGVPCGFLNENDISGFHIIQQAFWYYRGDLGWRDAKLRDRSDLCNHMGVWRFLAPFNWVSLAPCGTLIIISSPSSIIKSSSNYKSMERVCHSARMLKKIFEFRERRTYYHQTF